MIDIIIAPLIAFSLATIKALGYGGIFILMALESANVPIPSEATMPFAGFLASQGVFNLWAVIVIGAFANLAGSLFSYWLAVRWGDKALAVLIRLRLMSMDDYEKGRHWVEKYGQSAAFFSRMLPIVRTFVSFPAGMFRLEIIRFSVLTFLGSLIWSALLTYLGFVTGENWASIRQYGHVFDYLIAGGIFVIIVWWIVHKKKTKINHNESR